VCGTETHDKALRSSAREASPFVRSIQKETAQLAEYQGMLFSVQPSNKMCESTFWFATVIRSGLICRRTGTLRPRHEGKEATRPGHRGNKVKRKAPKVCITCKIKSPFTVLSGYFVPLNGLFHGFFNAWLASVSKNPSTWLKENLLSQLSCQVWKWFVEDYQRYSSIINFYRCLYGVGQVYAPHHTNVCKISWLYGAKASLALDVSPLNLLII